MRRPRAGRLWHLVAAAAVAGLVQLGQPAPAVAGAPTQPASGAREASGSSLAQLKTAGRIEIESRLRSLDDLDGELARSRNLAAGDRRLASGLITSDRQVLLADESRLGAETDPAVVRTELDAILELRVTGLLVPQVHSLLAAGTMSWYCSQRIPMIEQHIDDSLARRAAQGGDVAPAAAAESDLKVHAAAACGLAAGAHEELAGLRPAGWPASRTALEAAVAALKQARAELGRVEQDVAEIVRTLQPHS